MHPLLRGTAHRPWPLPDVPWTMRQTWHDLLFDALADFSQPHPSDCSSRTQLDTFDNEAWIAVVPFWMSGIRPRGFPAIPGLSRFPELNVRTYVRVHDKPGVYFFSLDAASSIAVWAARRFFKLPYFHSRMQTEDRAGEIVYSSQRLDDAARFEGRFHPIAEVHRSGKSTLEHFLTERYCLYTVAEGRVYRGRRSPSALAFTGGNGRTHNQYDGRSRADRTARYSPIAAFCKAARCTDLSTTTRVENALLFRANLALPAR